MKILIELPDYYNSCLSEIKNGSILSSIILKAVQNGKHIKDNSEQNK